jgi:hypothetical protein
MMDYVSWGVIRQTRDQYEYRSDDYDGLLVEYTTQPQSCYSHDEGNNYLYHC